MGAPRDARLTPASEGLTVDCRRLAISEEGDDPESHLGVLSREGGGESEAE